MVTRENRQDDAPETLDEDEMFWAALQPWLRSTGYELRRRYRPSWVPSWKQRKTSLFWWEFEDSLKPKVCTISTWFHFVVMIVAPLSDGREAHR